MSSLADPVLARNYQLPLFVPIFVHCLSRHTVVGMVSYWMILHPARKRTLSVADTTVSQSPGFRQSFRYEERSIQ